MGYYETPTKGTTMSMFDADPADTSINRSIEKLCYKLDRARHGTDEFNNLLDAITKLRASQAPTIVTKSE